ncbi:MAG: BatA domain-containing protein, partial [Planctomycetes bacterium]|nr:BatA domain-containing protein [Planctomycetota bacterium]
MSAFLSPGLLWGLLLAAVPILIHLLARRRYRTIRWAAQEFLRAAFRKNQKRLRVENLLLLIIRTALVVLLVFALARPYVSGAVAGAVGSRPVHYAVLLDNSYSMGFNDGLSTPFERALREARKVVDRLGREDSFSLYLTVDDFSGSRAGTPRSILKDSHDREKLNALLGRLSAGTASSGASRLADALAVLADELSSTRPGQQVVVLSDLTRHSFEGGPSTPGAADREEDAEDGTVRTLRDLFEEIARKEASISLVDVGVSAAASAGVVSLAPAEDRPLVERNQEDFVARVANHGPAPVSLDVVFRADGENKGSVRVDLPAAPERGRAPETAVRFTFPPLAAGPQVFSAEIPADGLRADDTRYYAAKVRERIRILAVDGDPMPDQGLSPETVYLKHAVAPMPDRMEMEVIDYQGFLTKDLEPFDLVILANVERLREDKVRLLEEFVSGGGGLIVFLGDRVDPGLLNRDLFKEGDGLLPGQIASEPVLLDRDRSEVRFDLTDLPAHPLLDAIFGVAEDPEGFMKALAPRVWGFYPLTLPATSPVLIRLSDAERRPALVEKRFGAGRVLLFTTAADLDWSDLPRIMIVPLLHEAVHYAVRHDPARLNLLPFEPFAREVSERVMDVQVSTPGGGRERVTPVTGEDRRSKVRFTGTVEPGPYRLVYRTAGSSAIDAGTRETAEAFAVSVESTE